MRDDLIAQEVRSGGRLCWHIKDPVALRYYRLHDEEYWLLRQLDGRQHLDAIRAGFSKRFAPTTVDIAQIRSFVIMLHREGLVVSLAAGQGTQLIESRDQQRRIRLRGLFGNVLAIRFRGFNPRRLLDALEPLAHRLFTPFFAVLALLIVLAAALLAVTLWDRVLLQLPTFDTFFAARNVALLVVTLSLVKIIHELGHALTCRYFGGECGEIGIMLLVFTPCLYCNVSDAWMMPIRRHRLLISAAGILVEVVLAAMLTLVWWFTVPGLLHSLALNLVFVCSVGTIVFNGNPLLRYDGYYMLADYLELPNLQQQAADALHSRVVRWFTGVEIVPARIQLDRDDRFLLWYAVASTAYRWLVAFAILVMVHRVLRPYRLEVLSIGLAAVVVASLLAGPVRRLRMLLSDATVLDKMHSRRFATRGLLAFALTAAVLFIPLPWSVRGPVVIRPADVQRLYVSVPGQLIEAVAAGLPVERGAVLARLVNPDIESELAKLHGELQQQTLHLRNLERRRGQDAIAEQEIPLATERLQDLQRRLLMKQRDQQRLQLVADVSGVVLPPEPVDPTATADDIEFWTGSPLDRKNTGTWLESGTHFCMIGNPDHTAALVMVDQTDIEFVNTGQTVRLRMQQCPGQAIDGLVRDIAEIDLDQIPLGLRSSPFRHTNEREDTFSNHVTASGTSVTYLVRVDPGQSSPALLIGAAGTAVIEVERRSIAAHILRSLRTTIRFDFHSATTRLVSLTEGAIGFTRNRMPAATYQSAECVAETNGGNTDRP